MAVVQWWIPWVIFQLSGWKGGVIQISVMELVSVVVAAA